MNPPYKFIKDKVYARFERSDLDARYKYFDLFVPSQLPSNWRTCLWIAPPPLGSTETECQQLVDLISLRDSFRNELEAQAESIVAMYDAFQPIAPISSDPIIRRAVNECMHELAQVVFCFKHQFSRTRPYQVSNLSPIFAPTDNRFPHHASYPSGHASQGGLIAEVLKFIVDPYVDPESALLRLTIDEAAFRIGFSREVGGLHFRSDTLAGLHLAMQFFDLIRTSPLISKRLSDARDRYKLLNK